MVDRSDYSQSCRLQATLVEKPKKESKPISKDVASTLIGKFGRGFDEIDRLKVRVQSA